MSAALRFHSEQKLGISRLKSSAGLLLYLVLYSVISRFITYLHLFLIHVYKLSPLPNSSPSGIVSGNL